MEVEPPVEVETKKEKREKKKNRDEEPPVIEQQESSDVKEKKEKKKKKDRDEEPPVIEQQESSDENVKKKKKKKNTTTSQGSEDIFIFHMLCISIISPPNFEKTLFPFPRNFLNFYTPKDAIFPVYFFLSNLEFSFFPHMTVK